MARFRIPVVVRIAAAAAIALATTGAAAEVDPGPYRAAIQSGPGSVARLQAKLGDERFLEVLKLNRLDRAHAMRADTLVVADSSLDFMDLSPWPRALREVASIPDSIRKVILVSLRIQAFAAYDSGSLSRWGPISSGGAGAPSRTGLYFVTWKARRHVSTSDSTWVMPWTVNIDPDVGTALHQYALPGVPVSHCCIRLLEEDARWIYEWVVTWTVSPDGRSILSRGTPVLLFGAYAFDAAPPWKRLPADPRATDVTPEEIAPALRLLSEPNGTDRGDEPPRPFSASRSARFPRAR